MTKLSTIYDISMGQGTSKERDRSKESVEETTKRMTPVMGDGPADIVFHGGDIFTLDDKNPQVEALAVKGEGILAVGNYADIESKIQSGYTKVIDLKGKTLLPGFIEAHQHAILVAAHRFLYIDIAAYSYDCKLRTKDEVLEMIRREIARATADPTDVLVLPWCVFVGWDIEMIPDLPTLSAGYLDEHFSNKIPLMILAQSGHAAWVNHKIFEICNITNETKSPHGGEYVKEKGELTGLVLETPAIGSILKHYPKIRLLFKVDEAVEAIKAQWKDYAARGFTTVTEMAYNPEIAQDLGLSAKAHLFDCPIRLALYQAYKYNEEQPKHHIWKSSKLWVAGYKIWADGSPHAGTSAVAEPYLDTDLTKKLSFPLESHPRGKLNWTEEQLHSMVKECHDQGKQVSIHAHGERAIDQSLKVYQQVMKPEDDRRHRLEHVGLITEDQLKKCGELGVNTSIFVDQFRFYGETFSQSIFGQERTDRWAPLSAAIKHVGLISIHQDDPTFPGPPLPFANMKSAITRTRMDQPDTVYGKEYCISIEDAIKAYTIWPAHQLFMESKIGSLEAGKFADLVILSTNPYKVDPMKLDTDVHVVETYIGGHCNNIN